MYSSNKVEKFSKAKSWNKETDKLSKKQLKKQRKQQRDLKYSGEY